MTDLRKAVEMALEALEYYRSFEDCQPTPASKTIPALLQALAEPEHGNNNSNYPITESITSFVDAVNISQDRVDETAKGGHEPVGYINGIHSGYMVFTPLNPSAVYLNGTALYTAPPKKEWVGLSDADIAHTMHGSVEGSNILPYQFARAIETSLKEKNKC